MTDVTNEKQTLMQQLMQRAAPGRAEFEDLVIVPMFAVVVALIVGALVMLATAVDIAMPRSPAIYALRPGPMR
jgi:hypothetical protein